MFPPINPEFDLAHVALCDAVLDCDREVRSGVVSDHNRHFSRESLFHPADMATSRDHVTCIFKFTAEAQVIRTHTCSVVASVPHNHV